MKKHVIVPSPLLLQLVRMAEWWADHRSADQALRWFEEIEATIESLGEQQAIHSAAPDLERFPFKVYQKLFGIGRHYTHRILYRIEEAEIVIIDVYHIGQKPLELGDLS